MNYTFTSRLMQMASGGAVDASATDKELRAELANELFAIETSGTFNYLERDYIFADAETILESASRGKKAQLHLSIATA